MIAPIIGPGFSAAPRLLSSPIITPSPIPAVSIYPARFLPRGLADDLEASQRLPPTDLGPFPQHRRRSQSLRPRPPTPSPTSNERTSSRAIRFFTCAAAACCDLSMILLFGLGLFLAISILRPPRSGLHGLPRFDFDNGKELDTAKLV